MKLLYIESTENIFNFFGETNLQLNIDIESSQLEVGEKIIIIFKSNDSFYINTIIEVVEILEDKLIVKKCLEVGKNIEYKSERLHIKIPELDDISDNKSKEIISKMIEDIVQTLYKEVDPSYMNKPLNENYLLGYYLQRKDLRTKKEVSNDKKEEV